MSKNKNIGPFLAFTDAWFEKNQGVLLFLLNFWLTRKWFRWVLRIRKDDIGYRGKIVQIQPNNYKVFSKQIDDKIELIADYRTHCKYSKRIYYAFKPLWWMLHYWDEFFADRYCKELSFGFLTLTVYPDAHPETNTFDGHCLVSYDLAWSSLISSSGNSSNDTVTDIFVAYIYASFASNQFYENYRSITLFNTASLTSASTISAAVLSVKTISKDDSLAISPNADVYTCNPASNTAIANADYGTFGSTSQTGSPIAYSSFTAESYSDFTLNATGISNVSKTSITKLGFRNANYDVANVAPAWSDSLTSIIESYSADQSGTTSDPKLVVTYTIPGVIGRIVSIKGIQSIKF